MIYCQMYHISNNGCLQPFVNAPLISRRQELSEVFALNGALYIAQTEWFNRIQNFISDEILV
jgi:CMP-N,N'-diacetyllegionaminic acid synthase